jgi:transposase
LDEQAMEIRLLLDHRDDLVADRTRTVNRLRWHLLALCPELERSIKRGALNQARVLDRVDRKLRKLPAGARVRIAHEHVVQLRRLNAQVDQLAVVLAELVNAHRPKLLAEQGCGPVTAAILIGHTAGNERFRSDASFGLQSGTSPIPCSSGKRVQHRLNRGGDRQLNHALHIIAIARAQRDPATQEYLARKEAEGKTKKGALRALKRHLARRFHHLLAEPPLAPKDDRGMPERLAPETGERDPDTGEAAIAGAIHPPGADVVRDKTLTPPVRNPQIAASPDTPVTV